ncbi:acyl-CoA dehydrogenase [Catellatospora methionotrophica]|uniref:Acyl-CoA dehydrogenase n=1 Tax=Catellatospora methionotrophica TaxID=121620 RepID=A0A8J3LE92_9ACTN|nr:acyl-CoA dehydrogenase family protein [Catellatospora methionotrophica]GIG17054.1 acyl-CoA dehydrogenase [Catellatospora methionotrophica]
MTLDLRYTEEQEALRDSVRAMLTDHAGWARVLQVAASPEPDDADLWRLLSVDTGLAALAVPEHLGGAGASLAETAVVLEELGRAVAPVPYLGTTVAAQLLLHLGEDELLRDLAGGAIIAPAMPCDVGPAGPGARLPDVEVSTAADGSPLLNGTVCGVADASRARVLVMPAGGALFAVDADAAGLRRTPVVSLDETRPLCDLAMWNAPARLLAAGERAASALDAALVAGAALLASEQLGLAQWCLDTTVAHLRTRYQFGRPVGSFQALKHRLADLWVELVQARAVARHAVAAVAAGDPDARLAAALAQAHCGPLAVRAAEECVQMHGGIGFTWEHPAHLYLKRAKSAAIAYGTAAHHRTALATLADLAPA